MTRHTFISSNIYCYDIVILKRNIQRVFSLISRLTNEIQHSKSRFLLTKALKELKLDDSRGTSIYI